MPEVTFARQGGEPTLTGVDFSFLAGRRAPTHAPGAGKSRCLGTRIQTTCSTLLDDEWCEFFASAEQFPGGAQHGRSGRTCHDRRYRVDKGGKPTHDRRHAGGAACSGGAAGAGIPSSSAWAVNSAIGDHPVEVLSASAATRSGARFIQLIPIAVSASNADGRSFLQWERPVTDPVGQGPSSGAASRPGLFDEWVCRDASAGSTCRCSTQPPRIVAVGVPPAVVHIFSSRRRCARPGAQRRPVLVGDHFVVSRGDPLGNIREQPMLDLVGSECQQGWQLGR